MNSSWLRPVFAAKCLAINFAAILCVFLLFGLPGICGTVGGLLPSVFPNSDLIGVLGAFGYLAGFAAVTISAAWLLASVLLALLFRKDRLSD